MRIHLFLQYKILCASALLLMGANTDVKNADGLTANDLSLVLYNQSIRSMTLDAWVCCAALITYALNI